MLTKLFLNCEYSRWLNRFIPEKPCQRRMLSLHCFRFERYLARRSTTEQVIIDIPDGAAYQDHPVLGNAARRAAAAAG